MPDLKTCRHCLKLRPLTEFSPYRKSKDGYAYYCKACNAERIREWRRRNPAKEAARRRRRLLRSLYKLTQSEYERMVREQRGRCACCGRARSLVVDHDHETGRVRGLLCTPCNSAIGSLGDTAAGLLRALAYLRFGPRTELGVSPG